MHYIIKVGDLVTCPICGKVYIATKRSVCPRTCSAECCKIKKRNSMLGKKYPLKSNRVRKGDLVACPICGKVYVAKRKDIVRCCSKECSNKLKSDSIKQHFENNPRPKAQKVSYEEKTGYKRPIQNPNERDKIIAKVKATKLLRYGDEKYNNCEKIKETMMKRYGVETAFKSDVFKKKAKQTKLERYGDENYFDYEKAKQTYFLKTGYFSPLQNPEVVKKREESYKSKTGYSNPFSNPAVQKKARESLKAHIGYEYTAQSPEIRDRMRKTMHKNNSFRCSKEENEVYNLLCSKLNLEVLRDYFSELYPFKCDFYVPQLDLYIEYQGTWHHGKRNQNVIYGQFDESNVQHQRLLNEWKEKSVSHKSYKAAIKVWTVTDPLKRKIAKENNLNWLEFWSVDEVKHWLDTL